MAKHKGPKYSSSFSYFLEEKIDISYKIVGYPDWLEQAIPTSLKQLQIPVRVNREAQDLVPVFTSLWRRPAMGWDLECSGEKEQDGLDPISRTSRVILAQLGNEGGTFVIQPELLPLFKEPFESDKLLKIGQNTEFDFKWNLKKYGIHPVRLYCTMLAEQILRAGRSGFGVSLLDLARHHAYRLISKEVRAQFIGHNGKFTEEQIYYAARDVALLFDIFGPQNAEIRKNKLTTICQDEFACIPAVAEMELTGVFMDVRYLALSIEYHNRELARLRQEIKDEFNSELQKGGKKEISTEILEQLFGLEGRDSEEEFDLDSTEQKLEALRRIGLTLENVQRNTLKQIEHKIAKLLVDYSIEQKLVSTYGQRLIDMIHPDDNRLHPQWKQLGMGDAEARGSREQATTIATGRMSGDFMQLPRPKEIFEPVANEDEIQVVRHTFQSQIAAARQKIYAQFEEQKVV